MKKHKSDNISAFSDEDIRNIRRSAIIKFAIVCIFIVIMIVFNTISWFTMNTDVKGSGMSIAARGPDYEILVLENGSNGQYYADYHRLVADSSAVVWQMVDANNMGNYNDTSENPGIKPGSYGMVSFYVKPLVNSVDLSFNFEIFGYKYDKDAANSADKMKLLDSDESPAVFLNGHILLFEERTGTSEDNFIYSKPILSNKDMQRVISQKTYTKKANDAPTQVDIYWIWPTTLSKVIDARDCTKISVTEAPFTNKTPYSESSGTNAYNEVVDNIRTFPDYYCKGVNRPANTSAMLSEATIVTDYDKYGDYYDQADNDIGMGVDFILLKLSVSQVSSSGE
ncbi:MAG: hypothetical protein K6G33_07895 [Ruminococcus sp.]|uniref:hypothetical protein n=1 Tax=Ruminococcus sp. TaxID=41978 RepID=UPI0025DC8066|nr:hypothetical protein [Ruminococcus sp.]MCR5600646.1 hypothetical protein [Ruminococcus sp.]